MPIKLIIPGQRESVSHEATRGATAGGVPSPTVTTLLDAIEVVDAFNLSALARDRAVAPVEIEARDDDILEIEVEGGFTLWTSVERYSKDLALLKPGAVASDGGVKVGTLPRESATERGVKEWFQSALKILRLKDDGVRGIPADFDPSNWPNEFLRELGLDRATKLTAWVASKLVMGKIESQLTPGPGLYTWADATTKRTKNDPDPPQVTFDGVDVEKPILVFIHGTASSTLGSFGAFLNADAQPHWQGLRAFFGEHIYAFEHRTMSESPIDNAIQLVAALPRRANLYLVSHSRGGMVGDLVCLKAVEANQIGRFTRENEDLADADEYDRANLEKLAGLLAEKQLRVERFVRCAAPVRGTLLASENIDTFLSVLTNLIGLIPGLAGSPLYEVVKRITLQIAKNRTDPALIPGLEAMMPTSPLVALLNASDEKAGGALGVVAGDIEGGGWLQRLGVFLTDHAIYEARDNDLVVNTDSMFNGARREKAYYVFDQGADVSHFNYFKNDRTRAALLGFLSAKPGQVPDAFRPIGEGEVEPVPMLRSIQARAGTAQPIVFVLPGIMGSHLKVGDDRVWLDYFELLKGGLGDIEKVGAQNVQPESLIGDYYRLLCDSLANSHEVIPFAYDWRRSVGDAAKLLSGEVEKALGRSSQPVRFVAHSMGGLVVRAMIAQQPDLWDRVCAREGSRFLMLGTPNRGSHTIVESLLGTGTTVQQLALLDMTRGAAGIAHIIAGFPGVLELLPSEEKSFSDATWQDYVKRCKTAVIPDGGLLSAAKRAMDALAADTPLKHVDRVLYVAGSSPRTVRKIDFVDGRLVLEATTEGDGRVTYQSGKLPGVLTWYMDAEHGDLANEESAFPALLDLLERGTTTRLSTTPLSAARGGEVAYRALPEPVLYPTRNSLTAGLMGQKREKPYRKREKAGFHVSVVHGDLRYAKFPIVVGHYEGDTIIGAEARINDVLDGALARRYALGLYPAELGSVSVVLRGPTPIQKALRLPSGAIVIGLGKWGELSAAQLADLIRRAALQYVLQLDDCGREPDEAATNATNAGLSVLLIGGNSTTNIATGDSVGAILRGIAQANRELTVRAGDEKRVAEVEIIECFADTAIEAAHAANRLGKLIGDELQMRIEVDPLLRRGRDGRTRLTPLAARRPWRRWEISAIHVDGQPSKRAIPPLLADRLKRAIVETRDVSPDLLAALAEFALGEAMDEASPHRAIRFVTLSDRARAEATTQQRQPELIERLIKDTISQTRFRADEARVLFELMIPSDLKDGLAQIDNVVFVVDAETAPYPWELMSEGTEPICVAKGLVRQLQTARYRSHIGTRAGALAYVVGDPIVSPPYQQLPGARDEAKLVHDLLEPHFDKVTYSPERLTALDVLAGLYAKPYRVIHLAGHGQYEAPTTPGGKARSGMVLDNGVFLTAVEIGQMRQVPELVFLNCCHIGQTGPDTQGMRSSVEFNRLAASVSRELIEMGVRAVVAAGWAVRDDVAKVFAATFYQTLLDGETFGEALKQARKKAWDLDHECNTWGAYQAYGDPDYRLDPSAIGAASSDGRFVDAAEFIEAVTNIKRAATDAATPEESKLRGLNQLNELVKVAPSEWLSKSNVLMALGLTYGEYAQFEPATRYLRGALDTGELENATTLKAVEQLANFEARYGAKQGSIEQLYAAIYRLQGLNELSETSERFSLIASAYKRIAQLSKDSKDAKDALEQSAAYYRAAHERNVAKGTFDPYPTLNWLTASALVGEPVAEVEPLLARCESEGNARFVQTRDPFDAISSVDVAIVRALAAGTLSGAADAIVDSYRQTFHRVRASAREVDSVANQLLWMQQMLEKLTGQQSQGRSSSECAALARIRAQLLGETEVPTKGEMKSEAHKPGPRRRAASPAATRRRRRKPNLAPTGRRSRRQGGSGIS